LAIDLKLKKPRKLETAAELGIDLMALLIISVLGETARVAC